MPRLKELRKYTKKVIKLLRGEGPNPLQATQSAPQQQQQQPDIVIDLDFRIYTWFLGPKSSRIMRMLNEINR